MSTQREVCTHHHERISEQAERVREEYEELQRRIGEAEEEIGDAVYPIHDTLPAPVHEWIFGATDGLREWLTEMVNL